MNRPPGLAPKGSSWGIALIALYAPGVPMMALGALSPWLPGGAVTAVGGGMVIAMISTLLLIVLAIGYSTRRYWGVVMFFWTGVACLVMFAVAVLGVALILLVTIRAPPEEIYLTWAVTFILAPMAPFSPLLVRALRLKYWQPWTRPEQWEIGDELSARWASPTLAARRSTDDTKPRAKPHRPHKRLSG